MAGSYVSSCGGGRSIRSVWRPTPRSRYKRGRGSNPNVESRWGIMPSLIATLSMMQTLLLSALSSSTREREQGTFDQLFLVTPYTPTQIMIGKAIPPNYCSGCSYLPLFWRLICFWFQIPMNGSFTLFILDYLPLILLLSGCGTVDFSNCTQYATSHAVYFLFDHALTLLSGLLTSYYKYA